MRGRLQRLGVLRESGHEHFNGSIVIPVFNRSGEVVEMYGRKITPNLREGTPNHLYLPGAHAGVWNEEAVAVSKEIILCESLIDALSFWSAGFRNVTASYGVNGFTADHRSGLREARHRARVHRLRPRRGGRQSRRRACGGADRDGHRVLPGDVPEGHGRERILAQSAASGEELGRVAQQSRVAGQGQEATGAANVTELEIETAPESVADVKEEPAAKEEMIEEEDEGASFHRGPDADGAAAVEHPAPNPKMFFP